MRQITATLGDLGLSLAAAREGWLLVRAWLRARPDVRRVGPDYWVPAAALPPEPVRRRLRVLPAMMSGQTVPVPPHPSTGAAVTTPTQEDPWITGAASQAPLSGPGATRHVSWTVPLRTVHLLDGFIPVPAAARAALPPRSIGEGDETAVRGLWFDTGERLWLWLDRAGNRLYGPHLAEQLAWREAGDLLLVEWAEETVVLRLAGHDDEIQREETRLIDVEALAALRGGLGESYRQSLQAILASTPEGLPFAAIVSAVRERQGHTVHRGTIRSLLHAGGFTLQDGRWFAAPDNATGARKLRSASVATLLPDERSGEEGHVSALDNERAQAGVRAIHARLIDLLATLNPGC